MLSTPSLMERRYGHVPSHHEWDRYYGDQPRAWRGNNELDLPFVAGERLLEAGCGNGKTLQNLVSQDLELHAVDFSPVAVEICRRRFEDSVDLRVADIRRLPYADSFFDGIIAIHLLSHLLQEDRGKASLEMLRVLKPGGWMMIRSFDRDDMRYGKGDEIEPHSFLRGNGILYHYPTAEEIIQLFPGVTVCDVRRMQESKRFHGREERRSWVDLILRSPPIDD